MLQNHFIHLWMVEVYREDSVAFERAQSGLCVDDFIAESLWIFKEIVDSLQLEEINFTVSSVEQATDAFVLHEEQVLLLVCYQVDLIAITEEPCFNEVVRVHQVVQIEAVVLLFGIREIVDIRLIAYNSLKAIAVEQHLIVASLPGNRVE